MAGSQRRREAAAGCAGQWASGPLRLDSTLPGRGPGQVTGRRKGRWHPACLHSHRHNYQCHHSVSSLPQTWASSWMGMASWQMAPTWRCPAETEESPSISLAPSLLLRMYYNHFLINVLDCLPSKTSILARAPSWLTPLIGPP